MTGELFERLYRIEIMDQAPHPTPHIVSVNASNIIDSTDVDIDITIEDLAEKLGPHDRPAPDTSNPLDNGGSLADMLKAGIDTSKALDIQQMTVANLVLLAPKIVFEGYYDKDGNPGIYVEWDISLGIDEHLMTGEITLANLSARTIKNIKENDMIKIFAGYRGTGIEELALGTITEVDPVRNEGGDWFTKIKFGQAKESWMRYMAFKENRPGEISSEVALSLLKQLPMPYTFGGVGKEITYRMGKSYPQTYTVARALRELAADSYSKVFVYNHRIFWYPLNEGKNSEVFLSSKRPFWNIIGQVEPTSNKGNVGREKAEHRVTALLDGRIKPATIFTVESNNYSGLLRAITVNYVANAADYYVIVEGAEHSLSKPIDPNDLVDPNNDFGKISELEEEKENTTDNSLEPGVNIEDLLKAKTESDKEKEYQDILDINKKGPK